MESTIDRQHKIVIWPRYIEHKDINDMFLNGVDVINELKNNVYSGLTAKTKCWNLNMIEMTQVHKHGFVKLLEVDGQ